MTHVNIDGDIICYSVGFASEGEPLEHTLSSVKRMIGHIVEGCKADTYTVLLTGKGNYRDEVATIRPYKGNRKAAKPEAYHEIRDYIIDHQFGWLCDGEEADDQLGIRAVSSGDIIATIDKDLDNVPGVHYRWKTPHREAKMYTITADGAMRHFYTQLLTGDSTDNIPGLYQMTGKRATAKIKAGLDDCDTPVQCWQYVYSVWCDAYEEVGMCLDEMHCVVENWLWEIGQLLWIRHYDGQTWTPPCAALCEDWGWDDRNKEWSDAAKESTKD